MRAVRIVLLIATLIGCVPVRPVETPAAGHRSAGAVASAEPVATRVGLDILSSGGGVVDAAVAVALALAVVHPQAGNLGGGGFAIVRWGDEVAALDFRETAPAAAHRDMFRSPDGAPLQNASLVGPLAAGVPGSPAGLFELHRRFGIWPWRDVVGPAVRLARDGFVVTPRLQKAIEHRAEFLGRFPETAAVWLPDGTPRRAGSRMRLPDLAATLEAYGERGPEAITGGRVAASIEAASRKYGGVLTAADLGAYRPVWREPIRFQSFGYEVASMPLPSAGGIILGQSMMMLERLGWHHLPRSSIDRQHLLAEVWRRVYADRFLLGDPATTRADASQLLDPAWIGHRVAGIDHARATPSAEILPWPGGVDDPPGETTHLSVVDATGNLVALTTTLNGWFGCFLHVPDAGFILNNEMDDFATVPGRPNLYGLIQSDANAVSPGARMLSSMTPTIAWSGDDSLALGSPGGSRIPTATLQVLLQVIIDRLPLQEAVNRPRLHHQWLPDTLRVERDALPPGADEALRRRGHRIETTGRIGEVHVVRRSAGGLLEAAADPRGPGGAGVAPPLLGDPVAQEPITRTGS